LEQSLSNVAASMGDKERSRENVGRREEGLKAKARQMELMVREAEARSYKMEQVLIRINWPVSKNIQCFTHLMHR
jgi:hypothetical protein